jgi:hypothetical protein
MKILEKQLGEGGMGQGMGDLSALLQGGNTEGQLIADNSRY